MNALIAFVVTFFLCFPIVPFLFAVGRMLGFYTIVRERNCHVYVLFGQVLAKSTNQACTSSGPGWA